MKEQEVYKIIDEIKETARTSDMLIKDRLLNYLNANVDEFLECFEEIDHY